MLLNVKNNNQDVFDFSKIGELNQDSSSFDLIESSRDYEELWTDIHDHCHLNDNKEKMLNIGLGFVNDEMIVLGYDSLSLISKYAHNEKSKKVSKFVNLAIEVFV